MGDGETVDMKRNATHARGMSTTKTPTAKTRLVAVYCRCSTDEQAASGLGLESQRARCLAYVEALGLAGDGVEVRVFVDAGYSAGNVNRPAPQELQALMSARRVSALVVAKVDRLSRRLRDLLALVDTMNARGVAFHCVSERIDTSTAMGRAMLSMLGTFAEFEREQVRERTRAAVAAKRARGLSHGFAPLGATSVQGRFEAVASEVAAVDLMIRRRAEGASLREIASELQAAGHQTKRGGQWRACTVDVVLRRVARDGKIAMVSDSRVGEVGA